MLFGIAHVFVDGRYSFLVLLKKLEEMYNIPAIHLGKMCVVVYNLSHNPFAGLS